MDEPIVDPSLVPPRGRPATADPLRAYRSWATVLCTLLVIVGVVGVVAVVAAAPDGDPWLLVLALGTAVLGIGVFGVEALGLDARAAWAVHAVRPLCVVLIVGGVIRALAALSATNVTIPLEAIGALFVLSRDHGPALLPPLDQAGRRRMALVVGLAVAVQLLPAVAEPLRRGVWFGAPESSLALTVAVACDPAPSAAAPAVAHVAWSLGAVEPFPPDTDAIRITWMGRRTDGSTVDVIQVGERVSDPQRIVRAGGSEEALVALDRVADPDVPALTDRVAGGLRDGWIDIDLIPSQAAGLPGGVEVTAWYAHGGRWVHRSGTASCVW